MDRRLSCFFLAVKGFRGLEDTLRYNTSSIGTSSNTDYLYQFWLYTKMGNVYADMAWETFLNSFTLEGLKIRGTNINTFSMGGSAELRLLKGLFFNTYVGAEFTKGVFTNLRKRDFNQDDILASVRQYPTTNSLRINFGFTYRFGSIYNNVVNPRSNANNFF